MRILKLLTHAVLRGFSPQISYKPNEEIDKLVNAFVEDVKNHFSFEEELMEKNHFFAYHIHREEHRKMLEEINRIKEVWDRKKDRSALRSFLKEVFVPWLLHHVTTMDTATANYIVSQMGLIFLK
ncbi:MAG: hemerythrin [Gammaproteobacteria bacterium]|nr:MAG: hemerythrin [Gammaproteobacteria bacterium]